MSGAGGGDCGEQRLSVSVGGDLKRSGRYGSDGSGSSGGGVDGSESKLGLAPTRPKKARSWSSGGGVDGSESGARASGDTSVGGESKGRLDRLQSTRSTVPVEGRIGSDLRSPNPPVFIPPSA